MGVQWMNDCSETPGDTWNSSHVKPCDIIYVKTDLMLKFFQTRHTKINVTYILLSGSRCVEQLWHLSSVQMHVQRIMSTATRCITVCAGSVDMSDVHPPPCTRWVCTSDGHLPDAHLAAEQH